MSTRVRLVGVVNGHFYSGERFVKTMAHIRKSRGMTYPEELRHAPKWKKAVWVFQNYPDELKELLVTREPRRTRPSRSKYMCVLKNAGFENPAAIHRERARAGAAVGRYRARQAPRPNEPPVEAPGRRYVRANLDAQQNAVIAELGRARMGLHFRDDGGIDNLPIAIFNIETYRQRPGRPGWMERGEGETRVSWFHRVYQQGFRNREGD